MNSFPNQRSIYTKTTEDTEKGVKIVTSVSVNDMEDSSPKIMFQQSHEPLSENPTHISTPVTNIMKINCSGSHVKLEIQEILQLNTSGIKNTFVFMNEKCNCTEMFFKSKFESTWIPDNESSEQPAQNVTNHNGNQNTSYRFTFGSMSEQTEAHSDSKSDSPTKIWDNPNYSQCCSDHRQQISTDFMLANHPSSPTLLLNIKPQGKRISSSDQFWDIPPPREFADIQYNTLEDLTHDLASCRIGARSPADKQQRECHPTPNMTCNEESGCPLSVEAEERADLACSFDQFSESGNYEPMLMRPSLSTNSFTKDFINCQKRTSWIRNNSIATVEHTACLLPKKRRQTFPGMSEGLGLMQEDLLPPCSESFSSLIMCSLPLQTERLGRIHQGDDRFSALAIGNYNSSQTMGSSKTVSENPKSHEGKQSLLRPFYMTNSEDNPDEILTVNEQCLRRGSIRYRRKDLRQQGIDKQSVCKDMESLDTDDCGYKVDQSEVADSGFEQQVAEVECHSPEPLTEILSRRAFPIQVIPPSRSGSEEQMLQSHPVILFQNNKAENESQENSVSVLPKHSKSSVMTITVGALEQRFQQMDPKSSLGSCMEKHLRTALEYPCVSPLQDMDVHSLNTNEVTEEIESKPFGEKTGNTSPSLSLMIEETNDLQLDTGRRGTEDSDKPAVTASCPAKGSADTEIHSKEQLNEIDKTDKQVVFKCK